MTFSGVPGRPVSRRSFLAAAAIGSTSMLLAPRAAWATAPGSAVHFRSLGALAGTSPVLTTTSFALVGVSWSGPGTARIQLRTRLADGSWTPWARASSSGHGPDHMPAGDPHLGDPVWCGAADAVQLRTDVPVREVRLTLISLQAGSAGVARALRRSVLPPAEPQLPAGGGQPAIIARAGWAGAGAPPKLPPAYGAVNLAFVHHTDGLNGYSAAQVPSIIYGIYLYHRYGNGWNDIGYNFVIDAFGQIWEARAGGIDLPVMGAHAGGYNAQSTGVAILGTFTGRAPSAAAVTALEDLLAWKLPLHGIPTSGSTVVEVNPPDAFFTPFRPGQLVSLPRIAGHRQGCTTDCPGNALYAKLPAIRAAATQRAGPPATLTLGLPAPSSPASYLSVAQMQVNAGASVPVSGQLLDSAGTPVPGETIELQQVVAGAGVTFATTSTDANGRWTLTVTPGTNMLLRALHRAAPATVSPVALVAVVPALTLQLVSRSPLVVQGTVSPAPAKVTVMLRRRGRRRPVLVRTTRVLGGRFTARLGRRKPGRYTVTVAVSANAQTAGATSRPVSVVVR